MIPATRYKLLVGGHPSGVALGEAPIVVGRSRTADVTVADPRVSRRHLELRVSGDQVLVRALDDAPPFSYEGRARRTADVSLGGRFVIGDTVLSIESATTGRPTNTATRTKRGGLADEARALSAIVELSTVLDGCEDAAAAGLAVQRWAVAHLGSTGCRITEKAGAEPLAFRLGDGERSLVVELPDRASPIVRALAAVAARQLASRLTALARVETVTADNRSLRAAAVGSAREFLGTSPAAEQVAGRIAKLARSDATALILGESGTGKTFAARLIHEASARAREPLRILNCAAIPENLFEAELFGAERGAFSGAVSARVGAFEAVGRGTLVLDEIGELDASGQAKLLQAIEERHFERLGSNRSLRLEARVLAATNRDLAAMIEEGTFRRDLYFRISVVTLTVPALRERAKDVPLLAKRILDDLAPNAGRRVDGFTRAALDVLTAYEWPGNVRELRNVVEHAIVLGDERLIGPDDLPERLLARSSLAPSSRPGRLAPDADGPHDMVRLPARLDWVEAQAIAAALHATGGNRTKAAEILGINRVTLQNKLGPQKRRV